MDPQEVEGGKTASRPADPIREGYTFAGWYEDAGFAGSSYDFEGKPVSADITLHAKWVPVTVTSYTVRYLIKDTGEALFDEVVRPGNVGAAVFANAKSHSDYVADALSKSIKLEAAASQNVITFWYSKPSDLGYTVKFVDEEGRASGRIYRRAPCPARRSWFAPATTPFLRAIRSRIPSIRCACRVTKA